MDNKSQISFAWKLMRYTYGAVVFLAGLDKLLGTDFIVYWPKYVSPFVASALPVSVGTFLIIMGIIEIAVAVLVFTRLTVLASYVSAAWLVLISVNLLMVSGYIDIAIRDILLAVGAVATAQLGHALGYTISGKKVSSVDA